MFFFYYFLFFLLAFRQRLDGMDSNIERANVLKPTDDNGTVQGTDKKKIEIARDGRCCLRGTTIVNLSNIIYWKCRPASIRAPNHLFTG